VKFTSCERGLVIHRQLTDALIGSVPPVTGLSERCRVSLQLITSPNVLYCSLSTGSVQGRGAVSLVNLPPAQCLLDLLHTVIAC